MSRHRRPVPAAACNCVCAGWLLVALALTAPPLQAGEGASRVNRLLVELKKPKTDSQPRIYDLSEADLNDFAAVVIASRQSLGIRKFRLDLQPEGLVNSTILVDMDKVHLQGLAVRMFRTLFSGVQELKTGGRLKVDQGKASYVIESASLNGISVPAWVVNSLIGYLGKRQPPHIDVTEPFDLPFGIRDIRIQEDYLQLVR